MFKRLLLLLALPALQARETIASPNILLSESTTYTLSAKTLDWPALPELSPLYLQQAKSEPILQGSGDKTKFTYRLGAVQPGLHRLPALQIGTKKTTPRLIHAYPDSRLQKGETTLNDQKITYYSALLIPDTRPFPGQNIPVEAKLYLPAELKVLDPAYPEFTKKNLAAEVFEPRQGTGQLLRNGQRYTAYSFTSRLSILQNGSARLGPGKIHPLLNIRLFKRGMTRWQKIRLDCPLPELSLQSQSLPEPKPEKFSGAIGRFTLSASTDAQNARVNAPLQITLSIKGPGASATFAAPELTDATDWKSSPASHNAQLSNENEVVFTRIIRPRNTHAQEIPSFEFTYYDPALAKYQTTRSAAIPIKISPAEVASPLSGFSTHDDPPKKSLPLWLWQLIPAALVIFLAIRAVGRRLSERRTSPARASHYQNDLAILTSKKNQPAPEFYRALGHFLEKNPLDDPAYQAGLLQRRDQVCYRPDRAPGQKPEPKAARILAKIKTLLPLLIFLLVLSPAILNAAPDYAALQKKYRSQSPSAARQHNLAICAYHLGRPGLAAWHLRRSRLPQSKNDLRTIEKETAALTRNPPNSSQWLAFLPQKTYRQLLFAALWLFPIIALARPKKARLFFTLALLFLAASALALRIYPRDISFAPLAELATVTEKSTLRDAPLESSETLREIPAASLAKIIRTRDAWAYIELPGQQNGWIPATAIKAHQQ